MRRQHRDSDSSTINPPPRDHVLLLLAELVDTQTHRIARLEIDRRGFPAHAYTRRRARRDDVPRLEGHETTDVADQRGNAEDHGPRVAGLHALAVHIEPHVKVLHVTDFVAGDKPGTDGAEGVAAFTLVPRAATFDLELAFGDIVDHDIAGDALEGSALLDVARGGSDDDAELDFPVGLLRVFRDHDLIIRSLQAADRLGKDDRLGGNGLV